MTVITKNNKEIELWINSKLDDLYLKNFLYKFAYWFRLFFW